MIWTDPVSLLSIKLTIKNSALTFRILFLPFLLFEDGVLQFVEKIYDGEEFTVILLFSESMVWAPKEFFKNEGDLLNTFGVFTPHKTYFA